MARNSFYEGTVADAELIANASEDARLAEEKAAAAAASATSAAASYDSFDDRYLGTKSSNPSVDNDSAALIDGALYFNTSNNVMMVYDLGNTSWVRTTPTTTEQGHINTVSGIAANVTTVAGISSDVTTVASISSDVAAVQDIAANVTAVAGDAADIGAVAAKATEIGRLGTAAAVADMAILGETAIVADMAILATTDVVADMNTLATSDIIADLNTLATSDIVTDMAILATPDIVEDMSILGTADIVEDMSILGTAAVVEDMSILGTAAVVEDMSILGTAAVVEDMSILGTAAIVEDMSILATSDIVTDMSILATSDIVTDMSILGTAAVVEDMSILGTAAVVEDMSILATPDIVTDMSILGTAAVVEDMSILGTAAVVTDLSILGTADVVADLNTLGTADVVSDMNTLGTADNVTNMNTVADNISSVNSFAAQYRVASSAPNSSLDEGDLYFNTTDNTLYHYNGSAWAAIQSYSVGDGGLTQINFTSADNTKLDGIEASATADQTNAEIKTAYEANSDTNEFSDAEQTKVSNLSGTNTGDQTITLTGDVTGSGTGSFAATIATDAVDIAMLSATGTAGNTTFLRGDNAWIVPTDTNTTYTAGTGITLSGTEFSAAPLALTTVQTAANQSAHLALTTQEGDVVVRSDENKSYVHNGGSAGTMGDFTLLATPTDAVLSVNSQTGAITAAHIKTAYEANSDTNEFSDAEQSKLAGIAASANNYTHPTSDGNKHIPSGGAAGQILRYASAGTAAWGADENDAVAMAIALG